MQAFLAQGTASAKAWQGERGWYREGLGGLEGHARCLVFISRAIGSHGRCSDKMDPVRNYGRGRLWKTLRSPSLWLEKQGRRGPISKAGEQEVGQVLGRDKGVFLHSGP